MSEIDEMIQMLQEYKSSGDPLPHSWNPRAVTSMLNKQPAHICKIWNPTSPTMLNKHPEEMKLPYAEEFNTPSTLTVNAFQQPVQSLPQQVQARQQVQQQLQQRGQQQQAQQQQVQQQQAKDLQAQQQAQRQGQQELPQQHQHHEGHHHEHHHGAGHHHGRQQAQPTGVRIHTSEDRAQELKWRFEPSQILVLTDGSEHSHKALEAALHFRRRNDMLHVVNCVQLAGIEGDPNFTKANQALKLKGTYILEEVEQEIQEREIAKWECIVLPSLDSKQAAVDYANEHKIDMLFIGSRGIDAKSHASSISAAP